MFNSERQAQILSCLEQQNTVSVQALSERLYASPSTIRRDLSASSSLRSRRMVLGLA